MSTSIINKILIDILFIPDINTNDKSMPYKTFMYI